jgi:anti-sigma factor RsiW
MVEEGLDARHGYCPESALREAAGWVLDALDATDALRFAEHLLTCRACQLAVADLQPTARALLGALATRPPENLATATLARVRQAAARSRG